MSLLTFGNSQRFQTSTVLSLPIQNFRCLGKTFPYVSLRRVGNTCISYENSALRSVCIPLDNTRRINFIVREYCPPHRLRCNSSRFYVWVQVARRKSKNHLHSDIKEKRHRPRGRTIKKILFLVGITSTEINWSPT